MWEENWFPLFGKRRVERNLLEPFLLHHSKIDRHRWNRSWSGKYFIFREFLVEFHFLTKILDFCQKIFAFIENFSLAAQIRNYIGEIS